MLPDKELKTEVVTLDGRKVKILHRGTEGDKGAIWQVFVQKQYANPPHFAGPIADAYEAILKDGGVPLIVDAGANIGTSAMWFAAQYPDAHLVAVEPDQNNFRLLLLNTAHLDVDSRLAGIDGQDGFALLTDPGQGEMAYRLGTNQGEGIRVAVVTIATLLAEAVNARYVPFLLKIDIEGSEERVFAGNTASIAQFPVIIIEPHDWMFPGQAVSSNFFAFHAREKRDFGFSYENIFSVRGAPEAAPPSK